MFGFFKRRPKDDRDLGTSRALVAPVCGAYVPIEMVSDPAFSQKMLGDGFAIAPEKGEVVSPVNATVVASYPSGHAFGLRTPDGVELIVHVGIDTVNENGSGFEVKANRDQKVRVGQPLVTFDCEALAAKGYDTTVVVVLLAVPEGAQIVKKCNEGQEVVAGETVVVSY